MNRKKLFDAIRELFGPLKQSQVDTLDEAIDEALQLEVPPANVLTTSRKGIELIHRFEGCARLRKDGLIEAYPDPGTGGKPWTIGWGSTTDERGEPIEPGTVWTKARADARFVQHLREFEKEVRAAIGNAPTTQNQFDAMVSLAYNIGSSAFRSSTLLKRHKAGEYGAAREQFKRWNRAGGRVMRGLTRRRQAEAKLYGAP